MRSCPFGEAVLPGSLALLCILLNGSGLQGRLPWWSSGWESACQCRRHRFYAWTGRILPAAGWQSPQATTSEPALWSLCSATGKQPLLHTTRQSLRAATKAQCSQNKWFFKICHQMWPLVGTQYLFANWTDLMMMENTECLDGHVFYAHYFITSNLGGSTMSWCILPPQKNYVEIWTHRT